MTSEAGTLQQSHLSMVTTGRQSVNTVFATVESRLLSCIQHRKFTKFSFIKPRTCLVIKYRYMRGLNKLQINTF